MSSIAVASVATSPSIATFASNDHVTKPRYHTGSDARLPYYVDERFIPVNADVVVAIEAHKQELERLRRWRTAKQRRIMLNAFESILMGAPADLSESALRLAYVSENWPKGLASEKSDWMRHLIRMMTYFIEEGGAHTTSSRPN